MKKRMVRVVKDYTNGRDKLKEGDLYELKKEFWFNGEGWLSLKDKDGKRDKWPDIFFEEINESKGE